ncbi:MAG TPA: hypothetical protein VEX39_10660 [Thermoleophilaceae bacterium]|nr:hypothetical protein [Thermoleophilaceae bacterium]
MADDRKFEIDELLVRPGTYFNPQTEVLVVVDDSSSLESEIFNMEEFEGADWVLIADELPVDEAKRDELLEDFQTNVHGDVAVRATTVEDPAGEADDPDVDDDPPPAVVPVDEEE